MHHSSFMSIDASTSGAELAERLAARATKRAASAPAPPAPANKRRAAKRTRLASGSSDSGVSACSPLEVRGTPRQHLLVSTPLLVERDAGELFRLALIRIKAQLASIHGSGALREDGRPVVQYYHSVLFKPSLNKEATARAAMHEREMQTLATTLDCVLEGALGKACDVLMGRYKALEEFARTGAWAVPNELEAIEFTDHSIVTEGERQRAAAALQQRTWLRSTLDNRLQLQTTSDNVFHEASNSPSGEEIYEHEGEENHEHANTQRQNLPGEGSPQESAGPCGDEERQPEDSATADDKYESYEDEDEESYEYEDEDEESEESQQQDSDQQWLE